MQRTCPWQLQCFWQKGLSNLQAVAPASDMWSFSILLAELATGTVLFPGNAAGLHPDMDLDLGDDPHCDFMVSMQHQMMDTAWVCCLSLPTTPLHLCFYVT